MKTYHDWPLSSLLLSGSPSNEIDILTKMAVDFELMASVELALRIERFAVLDRRLESLDCFIQLVQMEDAAECYGLESAFFDAFEVLILLIEKSTADFFDKISSITTAPADWPDWLGRLHASLVELSPNNGDALGLVEPSWLAVCCSRFASADKHSPEEYTCLLRYRLTQDKALDSGNIDSLAWRSQLEPASLKTDDLLANMDSTFQQSQAYFATFSAGERLTLSELRWREAIAWSSITFTEQAAIEWVYQGIASFSLALAQCFLAAVNQGRVRLVPTLGSSSMETHSFVAASAPALCLDTPQGAFITVPFSGTLTDVALLAHEAGHLLHYETLRSRYVLSSEMQSTHAESIAISFETLCMQHWGEQHQYKVVAQTWLAHRDLEWRLRHRLLAYFEHALYQLERVNKDNVSLLWIELNQAFYGANIQFSEAFELAWMDVSHLFIAPFYLQCYPQAYALQLGLITDKVQLAKSLHFCA